MSIQFTCVSCGKAVEIDDEWALRLVECPYCHDTITAPGRSTLRAPQARPLMPTEPTAHVSEMPYVVAGGPVVRPGPVRNRMAVVALVLACASLVVLFWLSMAMVDALASSLGPDATDEEVAELIGDRAAMQEALQAMMQEEPWAYRVGLGVTAGFGLWIGALVCSLVAMSRPGGRKMTIAALVIIAAPMLWMMGGAFLGA